MFLREFIVIVLYRDSVHRIHPMAGQGVNLGFGDVSELCEVIVRALSDGADPGKIICVWWQFVRIHYT